MDARTLEALKSSIAKWEKNAAAETPADAHVFGSSCPLCALFAREDEEYCKGCPVYERTGDSDCFGTPWEKASQKWLRWKKGAETDFHDAAREEVAFLKSLLPPEEAQ